MILTKWIQCSTSTSIVVGVPVVHLVDLICRIYNVYEGSLVKLQRH